MQLRIGQTIVDICKNIIDIEEVSEAREVTTK